jgi:excisionase family DNA binding protein
MTTYNLDFPNAVLNGIGTVINSLHRPWRRCPARHQGPNPVSSGVSRDDRRFGRESQSLAPRISGVTKAQGPKRSHLGNLSPIKVCPRPCVSTDEAIMARSTLRDLPSDCPLTTNQAATFLQLHPRTIQRLVREGRLKAGKVGRQHRYMRDDLLKAIRRTKTGGAQ